MADLILVAADLLLLLALGLAVPALATRGGPIESRAEMALALGVAMAAGLLADHAVGMLVFKLRIALPLTCVAAAISFMFALRRQGFLPSLFRMGGLRWLVAGALVLAFALPILFEPIRAWDARSIWFFHAKRIFYDGGLDIARSWVNPAYAFSHPDYPKLLPLLAAQFAWTAGVWNEYLPKASLLALLMPAVLGLLGACRVLGAALAFLAAAYLLTGGDLMWNGMADGYFALYAGLALVFWSRWLATGTVLELVAAISYLGVALNLKNEGALVAACVAVGLLVCVRRLLEILRGHAIPAAVWLALLLPLAGWLGWALTKFHWHAQNDLALGLGSIARAIDRVRNGDAWVIAQAFAAQSSLQAGLAALLIAAVVARAARVTRASDWFSAGIAALYMLGMFLIYLSTPHDLAWHLKFSVDRTLLTVAFGFFGSAFLLLEAVDGRPSRSTTGIGPGANIPVNVKGTT